MSTMAQWPGWRPTKAERLEWLKQRLLAALLTGETIKWNGSQRKPWQRLLADNGVELLSRSGAARRGIHVLEGAVPVVYAYFGAPIQRYTNLFLVSQTRPIAPPQAPLFERGAA